MFGPQGEPIFVASTRGPQGEQLRYSEDQPRDKDGKFASGGSDKLSTWERIPGVFPAPDRQPPTRAEGEVVVPEPLTPDATTKIGIGGDPDTFEIKTTSGASQIGYVRNQDFPNQNFKATRGELFFAEVPASERGKGIGKSLAIDGLRLMKANGCETVNISATSESGRGLVASLIKGSYISEPIQTAATGKSEYKILLKIDERSGGVFEGIDFRTLRLQIRLVEAYDLLEARYSDDQPRDDHGRWTSGGSSDASTDFKLADGRTLTVSNDPEKRLSAVRAFAAKEMEKLPAATQAQLKDAIANPGKDVSALSKDLNTRNGEYTPERLAEWQNGYVESMLAGHTEQAAPVVSFIAGGPASGKTTVSDAVTKAIGDHVDVNVDDIRTQIPEFTAMMPDNLMSFNDELGDVRDRVIAESANAGYNIVIDGVGSSNAAENLDMLKSTAGYRVEYTYVHTPVEVAQVRAAARPFRTENIADLRIVPEAVVAHSHDKARGAFDSFSKIADDVKVIDKSDPSFGKEGKLVFWRQDGVVKVRDEAGVRRVEDGGTRKIRIH